MAKKYTEKDLFGGSLFGNQLEEARVFLDVIKELQGKLNKLGKELKNNVQKVNIETAEGIEMLNNTTEELIKNTTTLNTLKKQEAKITALEKKLNDQLNKSKKKSEDLTDEEIKDKIKLQKINRERKRDLEAEIILEKEQIKTRKDMRERVKALRIETEKLDLTTEEGRKTLKEYNDEIDFLSEGIKNSSDEFIKSKINVGNYTESVKEALNEVGGLGDVNGQLGLILTAVNKIWAISTKRTEEDTEAKEENEKQTTRLGKVAKRTGQILKTSLIGLLASAGASLVAFFQSTQEGAVEYEKIVSRITASINVFIGRVSNFGKGVFLLFENISNQFELFKKNIELGTTIDLDKRGELKGQIRDLEQAIKDTGKAKDEAFSGAFAGGFIDQIQRASAEASRLTVLTFELANLTRRRTADIEAQRVEEEKLRAIYDDDTRGFNERQKASRELRDIILGQNSALDVQSALNKEQLELSEEKALQAIREKVNNEAVLQTIKEQAKEGKTLSQAILDAQELRGENGLLKIDTQALDDLIEAEKTAFQTEAELNAFRLDNRQLQRKLLFDEVEQELDFLIDGTDQIAQNNQRIVESERKTFEEREQTLKDTQKLFEDARKNIFEELAKTVDGLEGQDIADAFASAESVSDLNKRLKDLGLAEIPINRLLETFREVKTQERDIKDAQDLLFFAQIDTNEAKQRISVLKSFNEETIKMKDELLELSKVDLSSLSDEEFDKFQQKLEDFNKRREQADKDLQKQQIEDEIKALEERLLLEEQGSEKYVEIEEELANKRIELNELTLEEIKKQQEEAIAEEEELRKKQAEKEEKARKDQEEAEKRSAERRKEIAEALYSFVGNLVDEYFEKQQEQIEKELEASKEQEERLLEQAEKGVQISEESIAYERKKQAELEREKQQSAERQARAELLLASLQSFQANNGNLGKTLTDIIALREFVNAIPLFYDGTEDTGAGGSADEKGGISRNFTPSRKGHHGKRQRKNRGYVKQRIDFFG